MSYQLARVCNNICAAINKNLFCILVTQTTAMSDKYKMRDIDKAYFVTLTVVGWIDVFTRKNHKLTIVESPR